MPIRHVWKGRDVELPLMVVGPYRLAPGETGPVIGSRFAYPGDPSERLAGEEYIVEDRLDNEGGSVVTLLVRLIDPVEFDAR